MIVTVSSSIIAMVVLSLARSTGLHLRLWDVSTNNFIANSFLDLLVRHPKVSDHGRHLLVLVWAHGTLVRRVARRGQELRQV